MIAGASEDDTPLSKAADALLEAYQHAQADTDADLQWLIKTALLHVARRIASTTISMVPDKLTPH